MSEYGSATQQFFNDLAVRGALTRAQITEAPYGRAIRGRLDEILRTGRIKKIDVINPYGNQPYRRTIVCAYALNSDYAIRESAKKETWYEKRRREAKERMIERAIKLLEASGYKVVQPQKANG